MPKKSSKSKTKEKIFLENYSKKQIIAFLKKDKLEKLTKKKVERFFK